MFVQSLKLNQYSNTINCVKTHLHILEIIYIKLLVLSDTHVHYELIIK